MLYTNFKHSFAKKKQIKFGGDSSAESGDEDDRANSSTKGGDTSYHVTQRSIFDCSNLSSVRFSYLNTGREEDENAF